MRPRRLFALCAIVLALGSGTAACAGKVVAKGSLGGFPLCEASTIEVLACGASGASCLIVGDNEVRTGLFLFALAGTQPIVSSRQRLAISHLLTPQTKGRSPELSDIEAMARLSMNEVIVYGSYSRNNSCHRRRKRRQYFSARLVAGKLVAGSVPSVASSNRLHSCARLFGREPAANNVAVTSFCRALSKSETYAERARKDNALACSAEPAFNIEGAVSIANKTRGSETWVGLRAPLVGGKAVLLRHKGDRRAFKFDAIALVDLKGAGIRALARDQDAVWVISGKATDSPSPHMLWRFAPGALKSNGVIAATPVMSLPTSSEGLAVHRGKAIIAIDGEAPKAAKSAVCKRDSLYIVIDLKR